MKKIITSIGFMILIATVSKAQNGSPYWSTSGNSNATGTSKLGTTNAISIHFYTNNTQRMYIDSVNGRVGVGVSAPMDRLHVNSSSGENSFRAQVSGTTKLLVHSNGGTALGGNTTPPPNGLYVSGNTGLGNNTPAYKLEVKGDIAIDSGVFRITGDPVLKYNTPNQSIAVGNSGGTGTRLNTAVGYQALNSNTTGQANTAIGHKTLFKDQTGYSNIAIGSHALYNNVSGYQSVAVGDSALFNNTSNVNVGVGSKALYSNTTGGYNIGLGYQALYSNTTGGYNSSFGSSSLRSNTTGYYNTAGGYTALYSNTTGNYLTAYGGFSLYSNTSGSNNVASGYASLYSNTSGSDNTAHGYGALEFNTTGGENTASGYYALLYNSTGSYLTAVGSGALYLNTSGSYNSAAGFQSLYNNSTGYQGTANGYQAAFSNTTAYQNTAIGYSALFSNATSNQNTAVGSYSMNNNTGGGSNTAIGSYSGYYSSTNGTFVGWDTYGNQGSTNSTAIGYHAPTTADNQVRLGDGNVTSIGGAVGFSVISDGRFKNNVKENVPGLSFIKLLRPVTYHFDPASYANMLSSFTARPDKNNAQQSATDKAAADAKSKILYTGFIAQDVEKAAKSIEYDFSGVDAPKNDKDYYGLRYSDFVVPLVKAVQELSVQNDSLRQENSNIEARLERLEALLKVPASIGTTLSDASLEQNAPNPFNGSTTIRYTLPQNFTNAQIMMVDAAGKLLKTVNISGSGKGSVNVDANTLSSGVYHYSLYVNGKLADTKQMILAK